MSSFVRSVTLNVEAEDLEDTAMGDAYRSRIGGLKDWSVDVEFNQDFAASAVRVSFFASLWTVVKVTVGPTSAAIRSTNPEYSGSVLVNEYNPLDGSVGDLAPTSVSWPGAGALSRATTQPAEDSGEDEEERRGGGEARA